MNISIEGTRRQRQGSVWGTQEKGQLGNCGHLEEGHVTETRNCKLFIHSFTHVLTHSTNTLCAFPRQLRWVLRGRTVSKAR